MLQNFVADIQAAVIIALVSVSSLAEKPDPISWTHKCFIQGCNIFIPLEDCNLDMKTYLTIVFSSDGETPSLIRDRLMNLGMQVTQGGHDFTYVWDKEPDVDTLLMLADKIFIALKGTGALFSLETM